MGLGSGVPIPSVDMTSTLGQKYVAGFWLSASESMNDNRNNTYKDN